MGQSQEPITYDRALLQALGNALSTSRMAPYLAKAQGDLAYAYQLYLWNARLAKSFLYPLGVLEVAVRNAMHGALSNAFGTDDWVLTPTQHYPYFNGKHSPRAVWRSVVAIVYRLSLWTHTRTPAVFKFCRSLIPAAVAVGRITRRSGSLRKAMAMA